MADNSFNTHPQPRTFAPSKEDVLQNLQYFFGAPVSPEKLTDYSEHHAMTCAHAPTKPCILFKSQWHCLNYQLCAPVCLCADHFPDAYAGQNT